MNKIILSTCVLFAIITRISCSNHQKHLQPNQQKQLLEGQKSKPAANAQKETTSVVDQSATTASSSQEKFTVKLRTPSYTAGLTYLCYHMGKNLNIEDSALITEINNEGVAVFTGERKLQGGIYAIVFPGRNITFDFFVDKEQNIEIYADSITPIAAIRN
jgi:Zn-dependent metalloprotease